MQRLCEVWLASHGTQGTMVRAKHALDSGLVPDKIVDGQVCPLCHSHGHGDRREGHFNGHGNCLDGKEPLNSLLNGQAIQTAIVQTNGHLKENNCPFTWPMSMQMALKWPHDPVHSHGFIQVNGVNIS
jgi:hypothetical protein